MELGFLELHSFSKVRENVIGNDDEFRALQNELMDNPRKGHVIPGAAGLRKVRWAAPGKGKGKRGGSRVIYLFVEERAMIVFFTAYSKNEATDLTPEQKKAVAAAALAVREELLQNRRTEQ